MFIAVLQNNDVAAPGTVLVNPLCRFIQRQQGTVGGRDYGVIRSNNRIRGVFDGMRVRMEVVRLLWPVIIEHDGSKTRIRGMASRVDKFRSITILRKQHNVYTFVAKRSSKLEKRSETSEEIRRQLTFPKLTTFDTWYRTCFEPVKSSC